MPPRPRPALLDYFAFATSAASVTLLNFLAKDGRSTPSGAKPSSCATFSV
jgi:hypothetical protein